jgi:hypothetical protein
MEDTPASLTPAKREDIAEALSYAMRFNLTGKPYRHGSEVAVPMVVDLLLDHLERSGFVLMKRPPGRAHTAG